MKEDIRGNKNLFLFLPVLTLAAILFIFLVRCVKGGKEEYLVSGE